MEEQKKHALPDYIPLHAIQQAAENFKEIQRFRTPLVPLNFNFGGKKIYLKLESLQPIGSFKIRGASNALTNHDISKLGNDGVYTASAGNFAQGLAWSAKQRNIPCKILVPQDAPITKLDAIERLGGHVIKIPYDDWWNVIENHHFDGMQGTFIHPVCEEDVIAGNGTIGLEIYEDLPEVDVIICPYGGGGLITGIASAMKSLKPDVQVYASEVNTASPLHASFDLGKPTSCNFIRSFVDGMGGKSVLPKMWPLVKNLVTDSIVVTLQEVVDAIKLLAERNHIIAEGAGAATVASALCEEAERKLQGNIVCVISGGNIDTGKLIEALNGNVPQME